MSLNGCTSLDLLELSRPSTYVLVEKKRISKSKYGKPSTPTVRLDMPSEYILGLLKYFGIKNINKPTHKELTNKRKRSRENFAINDEQPIDAEPIDDKAIDELIDRLFIEAKKIGRPIDELLEVVKNHIDRTT